MSRETREGQTQASVERKTQVEKEGLRRKWLKEGKEDKGVYDIGGEKKGVGNRGRN